MSKWRGFELLAEQIYSELDARAEVLWNDFIVGRYSAIARQIDVSIRWDDAGRPRLSIVQVKDWKTPASITAVGEFSSVVRDVGADKGIMVCRSGFSKSAKTYAKNVGIELHNLHDAQSQDWNRSLTVPILWQEQAPQFDIRLNARMDAGDQVDSTRFGVVNLGAEQRDLQELFTERWNAGELPRNPGLVHLFAPGGPVSISVTRPDGTSVLRPTARLELGYEVAQTSWLGQFEPAVCRGYVNYLDQDAFTVSYLPVGEVPCARGTGWTRVSDPKRVAVSVAGSLVTTEMFGLNVGARSTKLSIQRIGS